MHKKLALIIIVVLLVFAVWYLETYDLSEGGEAAQTLLQEEIDAIIGAASFKPVVIGKLAPDFALERFDVGDVVEKSPEIIRLSDYRGEKTVVLNFWASWCTYCTVEMPLLEKFHRDYGDQAVVIGVNLQENYLDVLAGFVKGIGVTYPILLDPDATAKKNYRVVVQPQTFFIDKDGVLRDVHYGPFTVKQLLEKGHKIVEASD